MNSLGVTAAQAVMIGDDVKDDCGGALAVGLSAVLVQTGKYRPGDETLQGVTPTAVAPSLVEAVDWVLQRADPLLKR